MIFHPCKNLNSLQNLKSREKFFEFLSKILNLCYFVKSYEKNFNFYANFKIP